MVQRQVQISSRRHDDQELLTHEWLVTNGLGGYSSLALNGAPMRKYHGWLIAALPSPLGRTVMLNYLHDVLILPDGSRASLSSLETIQDGNSQMDRTVLTAFWLENGLPVWRYEIGGVTLEKRALMVYQQNTLYISYKYVEGPGPIQLKIRPYFNFRHHEDVVNSFKEYHGEFAENKLHMTTASKAEVWLTLQNGLYTPKPHEIKDVFYRIESERGYDCVGNISSPGYFSQTLSPSGKTTFMATTDRWEKSISISSDVALEIEQKRRQTLLDNAISATPCLADSQEALELVLAADQFIIVPASRVHDNALLEALGEHPKTIVAGYHWFADWGRDTMIALEGLALVTGRFAEAQGILRTFVHYIHHGLIPNMFPDGEEKGLYNTADATLWLFHALDRYATVSGDAKLIRDLLPKLEGIIHSHLKGTDFGIHCDPTDGLLVQGLAGYALTWMDAKVGDLVVTPRRGKAVEINALWYNALCIMIDWSKNLERLESEPLLRHQAELCRKSFNEQFWNDELGYLYDVIDGEKKDSSCRPNQIFSLSLKHPILDPVHWKYLLDLIYSQLLSRVGLRSLGPMHSDYKIIYQGNLFLRDSAYHQGTVWGWLIGPFIDAWLRVYPERCQKAVEFLEGFKTVLGHGCVGTIDEIFDAKEPNLHRGCIAQAWSVAEVLRSYAKVLDFANLRT